MLWIDRWPNIPNVDSVQWLGWFNSFSISQMKLICWFIRLFVHYINLNHWYHTDRHFFHSFILSILQTDKNNSACIIPYKYFSLFFAKVFFFIWQKQNAEKKTNFICSTHFSSRFASPPPPISLRCVYILLLILRLSLYSLFCLPTIKLFQCNIYYFLIYLFIFLFH